MKAAMAARIAYGNIVSVRRVNEAWRRCHNAYSIAVPPKLCGDLHFGRYGPGADFLRCGRYPLYR